MTARKTRAAVSRLQQAEGDLLTSTESVDRRNNKQPSKKAGTQPLSKANVAALVIRSTNVTRRPGMPIQEGSDASNGESRPLPSTSKRTVNSNGSVSHGGNNLAKNATLSDMRGVEHDDSSSGLSSARSDISEDDGITVTPYKPNPAMRATFAASASPSADADDIGMLNCDDMEIGLEELYRTADGLLNLILHDDDAAMEAFNQRFSHEASRERKQYQQSMERFYMAKAKFTTTEYIQLNTVLRVLFDLDSVNSTTEAQWRPDPIIHKANLAQMLNDLMYTEARVPLSTLQFIEALFPTVVADSSYNQLAFELALELTTQLVLARLEEDKDQDPAAMVTGSFWIDPVADTKIYWHWATLKIDQLSSATQHDLKDKITKRLTSLRKPISTGYSHAKLISKLRDQYSVAKFNDVLLAYCRSRRRELNKYIGYAGGIDAITAAVSKEVQHRRDPTQEADIIQKSAIRISALASPENRRNPVPDLGSSVLEYNPRGTAILKQMMKATETSPRVARTARVVSVEDHAVRSATEQQLLDNQLFVTPDEDIDQIAEEQGHPAEAEYVEDADNAESIEEHGFTEPTRTSVNQQHHQQQRHQHQQSTAASSSAAGGVHRSVLGKHVLEEDSTQGSYDFAPTQDRGFQTSSHESQALAQRRASKPQARAQSAPQRRQGHSPEPTASSSRSAAEAANHAVQDGDNDVEEEEDDEYVIDNATGTAATFTQSIRRLTDGRSQDRRQLWSDEETDHLDMLLSDYYRHYWSVAWVDLKEDDKSSHQNVLGARTNEDCRAKARNMKVDKVTALGDASELEGAWRGVRLNRTEVARIHSRGLEYDKAFEIEPSAKATPRTRDPIVTPRDPALARPKRKRNRRT